MMTRVICPDCGTEGSISMLEVDFEGPYMCWKCRSLYKITLKDRILSTCQSLSQEEFDRMQEIQKLKNKFKKEN